jgi:ABC-type glycerol-3-phosphate transport system substrate-binding protein
MPEITRFYGIVIKVFFGDHPPPHFHAIYGEYNALLDIESLTIIEGDLPSRAQKMVEEWARLYQKDLLDMWNSQEFRKLPPLK